MSYVFIKPFSLPPYALEREREKSIVDDSIDAVSSMCGVCLHGSSAWLLGDTKGGGPGRCRRGRIGGR